MKDVERLKSLSIQKAHHVFSRCYMLSSTVSTPHTKHCLSRWFCINVKNVLATCARRVERNRRGMIAKVAPRFSTIFYNEIATQVSALYAVGRRRSEGECCERLRSVRVVPIYLCVTMWKVVTSKYHQ